MTRPSRNQDRLLIEAGKKLLAEVGVSGMSIQKVADEAGVNLGMFSYHFKTKANFIRMVLESIKEDAIEGVRFEMPTDSTSIERLRSYLTFLGQNFRAQSGIALAMFRDFLNQDPDISELVLSKSMQEMELLRSMIRQCQKDGYVDPGLSVEQIEVFCNSAIKGPVIISAAIERLRAGKKKASATKRRSLDNDATAGMVDMILRGLEPRKKRK